MNTEMRDRLHDWQESAAQKAREVAGSTNRYVHDSTWTAVAIAMAAGLVLGFLLSGRRD